MLHRLLINSNKQESGKVTDFYRESGVWINKINQTEQHHNPDTKNTGNVNYLR